MHSGIAELPLHYGKSPKWLFEKMVKLSKQICEIIIYEFGKKEFLKRISNPYFFQAFGCLIGWDFHSSGLTTTLTAAIKEAKLEKNGIFVCGGKGKASLKTLEEIESFGEKFDISYKNVEELKKVSRLCAKIDNALLQDGYNLYHHSIIFDEKGNWTIIQQGMNIENKYARRYHWLSFNLKDFFKKPHKAICCNAINKKTLNLVDKESEETRKCILDLINSKNFLPKNSLSNFLKMPESHLIDLKDYKKILEIREFKPKDFEEFILLKKIGAKTIRALALISNLIYGTKLSWKDPVKYSFAHGGKDGTPFKIDKKVYDESIKTLKAILENINKSEILGNLKKIQNILPEDFK